MSLWHHPPIVETVDFVPEGRWALLGPNGAGKTTLLRLMAGTLGDGGLDSTYLPQVPYMFRGPVRLNLAVGLDAEETCRAVQLLEALGFGAARMDQPATHLSGGERQRVALARVLARRAPLVLLDEPLAAISAGDRFRVAAVIAEAIGRRDSVIVTHDLTELAALADRVAIMFDGRIRQEGELGPVMAAPVDSEVAALIGVSNILDGVVEGVDGGLVTVRIGELTISGLGDGPAHGSRCRVMFGAESIAVYDADRPERGSPRNQWSGTIVSLRGRGRLMEAVIEVGCPVVATLTPGAIDALGLKVGGRVRVSLKATAVRVVGI